MNTDILKFVPDSGHRIELRLPTAFNGMLPNSILQQLKKNSSKKATIPGILLIP